MPIRWSHFVMIVLCAAMAFGGTFTCRGSSGDDDDGKVIVTTRT